jgi:hypothetical protein
VSLGVTYTQRYSVPLLCTRGQEAGLVFGEARRKKNGYFYLHNVGAPRQGSMSLALSFDLQLVRLKYQALRLQ